MRDHREVIEALERKADDRAVGAEERAALLAKASELRITHGVAREPGPAPVREVFRMDFNGTNVNVTVQEHMVVRNGRTFRVRYTSPTRTTASEQFDASVFFGGN